MLNKNRLRFKLVLYKLCILLIPMFINSCNKGFLEELPNKSLLIPTKLEDFQAILDNSSVMNISPGFGIISADNFFVPSNSLGSLSRPAERNLYQWLDYPYEGQTMNDWNVPYQQVFYANIVLDGLSRFKPKLVEEQMYNELRGVALFHRSVAFYNIAKLFCDHYVYESEDERPGIALRLSPDVDLITPRSTLKETYDRILRDLFEAEKLLPEIADYKTRPSKLVVKAMLARIYLDIEGYVEAERYANEVLEVQNTLIDFNILSSTSSSPFPNPLTAVSEEVIFYSELITYSFFRHARVDSILFNSYESQDLRKSLFFREIDLFCSMKANYSGNYEWFSGLAVDEMLLIRSECLARRKMTNMALSDLNLLLKNRMDIDNFVPLDISDGEQLLDVILQERRKELISRGLRWQDLKRLNKDDRFSKTLTRNINGNVLTLEPNSDKYVLPIPEDE